MPLRSDMETRLNEATHGTAVAGSRLTVSATIVNINSVEFELDSVMLHARSRLDNLGDDAQYVAADTWATVPIADLAFSDLPKNAYTHGTLTDNENRIYNIQSVSPDGSILRLFLSSQLV